MRDLWTLMSLRGVQLSIVVDAISTICAESLMILCSEWVHTLECFVGCWRCECHAFDRLCVMRTDKQWSKTAIIYNDGVQQLGFGKYISLKKWYSTKIICDGTCSQNTFHHRADDGTCYQNMLHHLVSCEQSGLSLNWLLVFCFITHINYVLYAVQLAHSNT